MGVPSSKLLLRSFPFGLLLLTLGCGAAEPTKVQWPVESAPAVHAKDPHVWIALAARLGRSQAEQPLELRSAGAPLLLRDASGRQWQSPQFSIRWRLQPLAHPFVLGRWVQGPFASFESADGAAQPWRSQGVTVTLVYGADWEIWAPLSAAVPAGVQVHRYEQRVSQEVVPVLALSTGALVSLQGPIQLKAPSGLRWQNAVYDGPFRLQSDAQGSWSLIEQRPLERYLEGVLPHEIGASAPAEALAAQAVLARTWALRNLHRYRADGYHLCATTQCQVYSDPRHASAAVLQAIRRTAQQLLTWQGQPIHAVYHASNGGIAAPLQEAWDASPQPYLRVGVDQWTPARGEAMAPPAPAFSLASLLQRQQGLVGSEHPLFRWTRELDRGQIGRALAQHGIQLGEVQRLRVVERGSSGRVVALAIEGSTGSITLQRDAIRRVLRRLPSTLFELRQLSAALWRFEGGGFGHGVGLSQAGAIALGGRGWSYSQILQRYYPGTALQRLQQLRPSAIGPQP